jgi:hypothetical protein
MDFTLIAQVLDGGSDMALIFIAWSIWRLDRRVLKLEILTKEKN